MNIAKDLFLENENTETIIFSDTLRDRIRKMSEMDKIKESRNINKKLNEMVYFDGGVDALSSTLLGVCDRKIYVKEEADVYFDILDTRIYLKEKYEELPIIEALKYKEDVNEALKEADKVLLYILNNIF